MSKGNPAKAVAALLPVPISCPCGCTVRPLTLGMFAVLERLNSPLLGETPADGALSLIPSLYALTHDPADTLAPDLFDRSMAWADTLPPSALVEIRDAANRQVAAMIAVVPEATSKKNTRTGGSPSSPTGLPMNTAGAGAKSSGESRRRRSRSSAGSGKQPRGTTAPSR